VLHEEAQRRTELIQIQGRAKLTVSASFDAAESGSIGESLDDVARKEIAKRLREERVSPDFIYAFERTGNLVTDGNRDLWTAKALREWTRAFGEYRRRAEGDSKAIDLCFAMHHETGRTDPAKKKRLAASEFAIAVLCARDQVCYEAPWLDGDRGWNHFRVVDYPGPLLFSGGAHCWGSLGFYAQRSVSKLSKSS
jgi:hypothetical protein